MSISINTSYSPVRGQTQQVQRTGSSVETTTERPGGTAAATSNASAERAQENRTAVPETLGTRYQRNLGKILDISV